MKRLPLVKHGRFILNLYVLGSFTGSCAVAPVAAIDNSYWSDPARNSGSTVLNIQCCCSDDGDQEGRDVMHQRLGHVLLQPDP